MNKEAAEMSNTTLTKLLGASILIGILQGTYSHASDTKAVNKFEESLTKKKPIIPGLEDVELSKQSFLDTNTAKLIAGAPLGIIGSSYLTHGLLELLSKREQKSDIKKLEKEIAAYLSDDAEITDIPESMLAELGSGDMNKTAIGLPEWLNKDNLAKVVTALLVGVPVAAFAGGAHSRYKAQKAEEPITESLKKTIARHLGQRDRFTPGSKSFTDFIEKSIRPIKTSDPKEDNSGNNRDTDEAFLL